MPFNCLLWHCLQLGEGVKENNVRAIFQKEKNSSEVILIFKTDHPEYKKRFAPGVVSDFLFYYRNLANAHGKVYLVFVELGGNKGDHSVTQLKETVKKVTDELKKISLFEATRCYALVVFSGGSGPQGIDRFQREFNRDYQTKLIAKHKDRVDLRDVFTFE